MGSGGKFKNVNTPYLPCTKSFLGGLSSHLNYDWPFETFLVKLGHKGLFWPFLNYVIFWRFQGCLSTFQKMGDLRKLKFSQ